MGQKYILPKTILIFKILRECVWENESDSEREWEISITTTELSV